MTFSLKKKKKSCSSIFFWILSAPWLKRKTSSLEKLSFARVRTVPIWQPPHICQWHIPLPSALTCPHQRPRCHVCSLPKAPDEIFFFWAPHFSLLNQLQGDKCHRDWWAGLSQWGHPFLEGEKSHLSKQFWVITQREQGHQLTACHTQRKTRSDSLMNDRQIACPRSLTQRALLPQPLPRGPRWRTITNREGQREGASPLVTPGRTSAHMIQRENWTGLFMRKEVAPVGCRCFNFTSVGWESHSSSLLISWRLCPSPWCFPLMFGHRWRAERKEMELRPAAAARGGIMPQWSTA